MTSMPALVHYELAPGACELRDVPTPEVGPDDVLLRVAAVGVCGSDVHQYHNTQSWPVNVPVVKSEWDKTPRNAPCPCGSGKKFKLCHGQS